MANGKSIKTYNYRLYPSPAQEKMFKVCLDASINFYNMALAERKYAYENEGITLTKADTQILGKQYKKTFKFASRVHSHIFQTASDDLDRAFIAFFRRVKNKEKSGYPRFRSVKTHKSFGFKQYENGFKVINNTVKLSMIGKVNIRFHRPIIGKIKTCRIKLIADKWYISFACEVENSTFLPKTGEYIGIDVGINSIITMSNGEKIDNPKWYRNSLRKLKLKQRQVMRAVKGSNRKKKKLISLQKIHNHIVNQRKDFIEKIVFMLVRKYDVIAIEDLKINNMVRNHKLSMSILDASWGYFMQKLLYKAAEAGKEVILVNPRNTSKTCHQCNTIHDMPLNVRTMNCSCGNIIDRDVNAAINILNLALNTDKFKDMIYS